MTSTPGSPSIDRVETSCSPADNDFSPSTFPESFPGSHERRNSIDKPRMIDRYRVRPSMLPFIPYVEKAVDTKTSIFEPETAYKLDPQWIDLDVPRSWIQACEGSHGTHCNLGVADASGWRGPTYLIDVLKRRLVRVSSPTTYFALSYVWGRDTTVSDLSLNRGNLSELQIEGSLRSRHPRLPKLLDNVISLTIALGGQYLWVDRLCIVQDGGLEKVMQLNRMDAIYSGAHVTIVAAQPELRGLQSITGPRDYEISQELQHSEVRYRVEERRNSYDSIGFVAYTRETVRTNQEILEGLAGKLTRSTWYSRGWTFQEQLFSRRLLVFHDDTVNWECHCCAFHEAQGPISSQQISICERDSTSIYSVAAIDKAVWPDMYRYARLVSLFNARKLSFPSDVQDAFAGVLSSLSRSFKWSFIAGIPALFFDAALLWQPYKPLHRRRVLNVPVPTSVRPQSDSTPDKAGVKNSPPSWSWVGWQGTLHSESWRSAYAYLREDPNTFDPDSAEPSEFTSWTTIPTRQWFYVDDESRRHLIKTFAPPDKEVDLSDDTWERFRYPTTGQIYYKIRNDPSQTFSQPIPLRSLRIAHTPPIKVKYLTTKTCRARLKAGPFFENHLTSSCLCVELHHPSQSSSPSNAIGVLRFPFDASAHSPMLLCDSYEVIELSRGRVENQNSESVSFDEWDKLDWTRLGKAYEFTNVMAISWKDGIAYREAVGRVDWSAWTVLEKYEIDVVLG